jgi:hypothetical protein
MSPIVFREAAMTAIAVIVTFFAVILLMNVVDFGRLD